MQSHSPVHRSASIPYHSAFAHSDPSTISVPSPTYKLDSIGMLTRNNDPSQPYEGQGGLHQHGVSSSAASVSADVVSKKTRFTSDSNIPTVLGMGLGSAPPPSQSYLALAHHQLPPMVSQSQPPSHQSAPSPSVPPANGHSSLNNFARHTLSTSASNNRTFPNGQLINGSLNETGLGGLGQTLSYNSPAASSILSPYPPSLGISTPFGAAMPVSSHPQSSPFLIGGSQQLLGGFPQHTQPAFSPIGTAFVPGIGILPPSSQPNHGRTVYVGNLPSEASVDELLNHVKFGPIENVRVLGEKNCAFISFLDGHIAAAFHADASVKKLSLHGRELKIGWGKPSPCPTHVLLNVQQHQATRNVYVQIGDDEGVTEESLRDDLSRFGPIDQVKIVRDKHIGFIHFLSIATAIKVVTQLPLEAAWKGKRVHYGKDRCAYIPKSQQQNQAHNSQAAAMGMAAAASLGYQTTFGFAPTSTSATPGATGTSGLAGDRGDGHSPGLATNSGVQQIGNRTVYLGNLHPDTTTEEICNHVRGGILQTVRYIPEKHIAFVTFVDANSALAFQHLASYSGVMLRNRRLKIGWGKHSGPLSPAIAMAVQSGGSRNVYIGNISDPEHFNEAKLRADFSGHGEVELVNALREKNCAFVNFCNIQNAIKAIEAMKSHEEYQHLKIFHGKDRCGRSMALGIMGGGASSGLTHGSSNGGGGTRKSSGPGSPSETRRSSGPHAATAASAGSDAAAQSGHEPEGEDATTSAHDMPPIDLSKLDGHVAALSLRGGTSA